MLRKWKIYWTGFSVVIAANIATLLILPLHKVHTMGIYNGIPDNQPPHVISSLPESYVLYYAGGIPYICRQGIYFPYSPGDPAPIVYNERKPHQAYIFTIVNFGILLSIPFLFLHFIWFAFILKVYDPLMAPEFPRIRRTINIDNYQHRPRQTALRKLADQKSDEEKTEEQ
jgi:hypothetical protein